MGATAVHGLRGSRLAGPARAGNDPVRPAPPTADHDTLRFLVGLVVGLALVGAVVAGWLLVDGWDAGGAPAVTRNERVALPTATPAWPFRPEWLTPRSAG